MPASRARDRHVRSRPFVATVLLLSLLAASSFLLETQQQRHGRGLEAESVGSGTKLLPRHKQLECNMVHSADNKCAFVKQFCGDEDAGLLPYLEWYYCAPSQTRPLAFVLLVVWLGLLFTTIGIAASDFFSVNLSTIATILGLSESLAGVTFLAFGNGSPDVFSTFAAMSSNSPSMAVGELIGAACFITGVVTGSMALVREFRVDKKTYARDICFFIVAVAFSMLFLADGQLRLWECCVMVAYYVVYVCAVVGWHWYSTRRSRRLRREGEARSYYYGMTSASGDELAGEPYRDEPDSLPNDARQDSRSQSVHDNPTLEHGSRYEFDGQGQYGQSDGLRDGGCDEEEHERMIAAEVSRSMLVLRAGRRKSHARNPIRPSLVGALEFRSALAQLQRESNLQLSHMSGRSHSEYHTIHRPRRGSSTDVADGGLWETVSTPGVARDRSFSYGGAFPASAPSASSLLAEEASTETNSILSKSNRGSLGVPGQGQGQGASARSSGPSTPFMVGGNLAPPPVDHFGAMDGAKSKDGEEANDKHAGSLRLLTTSQRGSYSGASSPSSPFPRFTDSPTAVTPAAYSERNELTLQQAGLSRRENSFMGIQGPAALAGRPIRWWPYSLLPPPHVVFTTLFPTLQGWRDKNIWDKFLSTISVPSILLLVITLPVVSESGGEEDEDEDEDDEAAAAAAAAAAAQEGECSAGNRFALHEPSFPVGLGPPALTVPTGPQEVEPEGEWQRYQRYSRRNSVNSRGPSSPQFMVRPGNETPTVLSQGAGIARGGPTSTAVAKPLSEVASISHQNDEPTTWNRWLVGVQLFTGPLFAMLILWANMREDFPHPARTLVLMVLYTLLASLVLLACLFMTTSSHKRPRYHFLLCFMGFVISIAWISTIAGEVVGVLKTFGIMLNISEALLGLTIFAAGNSVGDLVADITVARLGYPVMALSACFGGPMLNILLGIGIGGMLKMVQHANKKHAKHPEQPLRYGPYSVEVGPTLLISTVTLLAMLILLLILVPLNKWVLSRRIGWGLIALWTLSTVANVVVELSGVWRES
ncbi:hypothetical protein E4U42_003504 [Claviceps africana]|uniref:Sodium/calcium exchanger membrane region domain-containing protein n=1 Tax=Claviceps africana TaxID=83212 RepID=A0A8K0J742_9HYPO|nr:hypothetical protein E4U42_003504 [Claviceps africana]